MLESQRQSELPGAKRGDLQDVVSIPHILFLTQSVAKELPVTGMGEGSPRLQCHSDPFSAPWAVGLDYFTDSFDAGLCSTSNR